jgi:hypothetical protein
VLLLTQKPGAYMKLSRTILFLTVLSLFTNIGFANASTETQSSSTEEVCEVRTEKETPYFLFGIVIGWVILRIGLEALCDHAIHLKQMRNQEEAASTST